MTRPRHIAVALVLLTCLAALTAAAPPRRVAIAVVVGAKSQLTTITTRTLMTLYLARPYEDLVPLNRPVKTPERMAFDARVLKLDPEQVGRYWVDQAVRGERGAPRAVASSATLGTLLARFPTAIGYMRVDDLPRGLSVVRVDGKLPGERGYPLWIEVP